MLLQSYKITRILPCLADPEKVRVIAEVSGEIHEVFPYLNATLKDCIYNHPAFTLTIKKGEKLITLHVHHITLTKIEDENEAEEILRWLQNLVNETYQNRDKFEPDYSMKKELKASDIVKLLPGTNCKECGEKSCFAFAFKLVRKEIGIAKCTPLFTEAYQEKQKVILELLHATGHDVPSASLGSQRNGKNEINTK
jgi:ArsR family metal-binding transcriptional regulator